MPEQSKPTLARFDFVQYAGRLIAKSAFPRSGAKIRPPDLMFQRYFLVSDFTARPTMSQANALAKLAPARPAGFKPKVMFGAWRYLARSIRVL